MLRDVEGLGERSAAALLGVRTGTVTSRPHRARDTFRKAWTSGGGAQQVRAPRGQP
ncbi:hypothetical protein [Streptomyces sp. NPDC091268]|uniref:hypothetical protein n=1 Tax=Streptomyces sp. NPDC091268 TaxID=3365979 RepID=UPI00382EF94E